MLVGAALGFVNHLLDGETWARARLQPFAGQCARFVCGPFDAALEITERGTFTMATTDATPTVTLTLPFDAPWRALGDRDALIAEARINGAADLAECLGFVLRHLRWDIEDDLAPLVGDIAARRLVQGGRAFAGWQRTQALNLAHQVVDYLTIENPLLLRRTEITAFTGEIDQLQHAVEQLEQRINALPKRSPNPS